MTDELVVDRVELVTAGPDHAADGLLGWMRCRINRALRVDGITLRRTLDGRLTIAFPTRRDRRGRQHPYVAPVDEDVRREIERQLFEALDLRN